MEIHGPQLEKTEVSTLLTLPYLTFSAVAGSSQADDYSLARLQPQDMVAHQCGVHGVRLQHFTGYVYKNSSTFSTIHNPTTERRKTLLIAKI